MGVHSGDHAIYPDCRPEFYSAIWDAFSIGNWDSDKVSFYLPYLEKDQGAQETVKNSYRQWHSQLGRVQQNGR